MASSRIETLKRQMQNKKGEVKTLRSKRTEGLGKASVSSMLESGPKHPEDLRDGGRTRVLPAHPPTGPRPSRDDMRKTMPYHPKPGPPPSREEMIRNTPGKGPMDPEAFSARIQSIKDRIGAMNKPKKLGGSKKSKPQRRGSRGKAADNARKAAKEMLGNITPDKISKYGPSGKSKVKGVGAAKTFDSFN